MKNFLAENRTPLMVLAGLLILGVGGYVVTSGGVVDQVADDASTQAASGWGTVEIAEENQPAAAQATATAATSSQVQTDSPDTAQVDFANPKTFTHPERAFSFRYPGNLSVGRFDERGGETVVVQDADERVGFQVYITPTDENVTMTQERIQQDLPDLEVRDPQPVQLGEDAGRGLAFLSDNEAFGGESREVWFTFNGYLYQISTYASLDRLMQQVLNSWEFR